MRFQWKSAPLAVALAVALPLRAQAPKPPAMVDGWTLTLKTTTDSGSAGTPRSFYTLFRAAGHQVRQDTRDESVAAARAALELPAVIVDDSAHSTTLVYDRGRRAAVSRRPARDSSYALEDTAARFITTPTMSLRDLGPGEAIAGHPTHRYDIAIRYVARVTVGGQLCKRTIDTDEQLWTATDLARIDGLRRYLRDAPSAETRVRGVVFDSALKLDARREHLINGVVLRSVKIARMPRAGGVTFTRTSSMEVTEISHGPLERSLFEIPDGFTITNPPAPGATISAAESTSRAKLRATIDSGINARVRAALCDPE